MLIWFPQKQTLTWRFECKWNTWNITQKTLLKERRRETRRKKGPWRVHCQGGSQRGQRDSTRPRALGTAWSPPLSYPSRGAGGSRRLLLSLLRKPTRDIDCKLPQAWASPPLGSRRARWGELTALAWEALGACRGKSWEDVWRATTALLTSLEHRSSVIRELWNERDVEIRSQVLSIGGRNHQPGIGCCTFVVSTLYSFRKGEKEEL